MNTVAVIGRERLPVLGQMPRDLVHLRGLIHRPANEEDSLCRGHVPSSHRVLNVPATNTTAANDGGDARVLQRRRVVDEDHRRAQRLVHVIEREQLGERLQEGRHHFHRKERARKKHHRKQEGVGDGRRAFGLLREGSEQHADADEGDDLDDDDEREPDADVQADVEDGVADDEDRRGGNDGEQQLVQDARDEPIGARDRRRRELAQNALLAQLGVHVERVRQARGHDRHGDDAGDEEFDEPVALRQDRRRDQLEMGRDAGESSGSPRPPSCRAAGSSWSPTSSSGRRHR